MPPSTQRMPIRTIADRARNNFTVITQCCYGRAQFLTMPGCPSSTGQRKAFPVSYITGNRKPRSVVDRGDGEYPDVPTWPGRPGREGGQPAARASDTAN